MAGNDYTRCEDHASRIRTVELETASSVARLGESIEGMRANVDAVSNSLAQWADRFSKVQTLESDIRTLCTNVRQLTDVLETERQERIKLISDLEHGVEELRRGHDRLDLKTQAIEKASGREVIRLREDINNLGTKVRDKWTQHDITHEAKWTQHDTSCDSKWGGHDHRVDDKQLTWTTRWWSLMEKVILFVFVAAATWALTTYGRQSVDRYMADELRKDIEKVAEALNVKLDDDELYDALPEERFP